MSLEVFPIYIKNDIIKNEDIIEHIIMSQNIEIKDNDILVISQKIISKLEGRIISLSTVIPSLLAIGIGIEYKKDPRLVEIILSESKKIIRMRNGIIIVETKHGFICANAGIDESNVKNGYATLLPVDSDESADIIRNKILKKIEKSVAVLISDTFGRPFRLGQTNYAIGVSGMNTILDYRGLKDSFNNTLHVTLIAVVDEICAAAELVMGKTNCCPVAIIRNYKFIPKRSNIKDLIRQKNDDLFI